MDEALDMERKKGGLYRLAWTVFGCVLATLAVVFFVSGAILLKLTTYWVALLVFAVLYPIAMSLLYWRLYDRSSPGAWRGYSLAAVVLALPGFMFFAMSPLRAVHLLLPSEERVVEFTVSGRVVASSSLRSSCLYFAELSGFMNNAKCGYSQAFMKVVRKGDVFSYRAQTSPVGYRLRKVIDVKRKGQVIYQGYEF